MLVRFRFRFRFRFRLSLSQKSTRGESAENPPFIENFGKSPLVSEPGTSPRPVREAKRSAPAEERSPAQTPGGIF